MTSAGLKELTARRSRRDGPSAQPSLPNPAWVWLATAAMLAAAALLFASGHSFLHDYTHDTFIIYDGIHRLAAGQIPHVDFSTPLGVLGYLGPYAGYLWTGSYGGSVEAGSVLLALLLGPNAAILLARRAHPLTSILFLFAILCLCVVPLNTGEDGNAVTAAMHYNRWGWAILTVLGLALISPLQARRFDAISQGLMAGVLLLALAFLKLSYFAVGLGVPALMLIYGGARLRAALLALLVIPAGGLIVWLLWPALLPAYATDLRMAIAASGVLAPRIDFILVDNIKDIALVVTAFAVAALTRRADPRDGLLLVFLISGGVLILAQNFQSLVMPLFLVGFVYADRHIARQADAGLGARLIGLGLMAVFLSTPSIRLDKGRAALHAIAV
ncbi:hypothetical protein [Candidatus Rhodobacter oscarellae]|uniref:hypothetical protein n=1 Tax=Candidatus Rhodobacter oscarellae TaxID=1675527 RepID=UPI00128F4101|nr:hypothetical protein [Candidatus Rhodobacter lobularis]